MTDRTPSTQAEAESPIELLRRVSGRIASRREVLGTTAKVGTGGALLSAGTAAAGGTGDETDGDTPRVVFDDQETTGASVIVGPVFVPEDGYVAIHDASLLDGEVLESVIGVSGKIETGFHETVEVPLFTEAVEGKEFDRSRLTEDQTLIAMLHETSIRSGDEFRFVASDGEQDGPFTVDGSPVTDEAQVTVLEEGQEEETDSEGVSTLDVLNFALTLEHLEASYYNQFLDEYSESEIERSEAARIFAEPGLRFSTYQKIEEVRDHEEAHVEALTQTIQELGGDPVNPLEYEFPYDSIEEFVALSATIEAVGVSAYAGAAPLIDEDDDSILEAALSIHSVEAKHTAYFRVLNENTPFPSAFDESRTMEEVLEIVSAFIVGE
jgi:rubrerythrin